MRQPYKFIVTIELVPGARDEILARAPEVQSATRAENGCLSFDCFICTDNPDRLVLIESWEDEQAHAEHLLREHTQRFLEFSSRFTGRLPSRQSRQAPDAQSDHHNNCALLLGCR